jgi:uncharacterized iron-regulated membrane protein
VNHASRQSGNCPALLIEFAAGALDRSAGRNNNRHWHNAFGFWPYMAICGGLTAFMVIAAFTWDHVERSRR